MILVPVGVILTVLVAVGIAAVPQAIDGMEPEAYQTGVTCDMASCDWWGMLASLLFMLGGVFIVGSLLMAGKSDDVDRCHACRAKLREPLHCYSCGEPQKDSAWGRS